MNPVPRRHRWISNAAVICSSLILWAALSSSISAQVLKPADPLKFYINPGQDTVLHWTDNGTIPDGNVPCRISGYDGAKVSETKARRANGDIALSVNLPEGFYTVSFPDQNQVFGIFVQPAFEGAKDPFFGMDTGLSWLGPKELRPSFVGTLHRIGVSIARERVRWPEIQPTPKSWDWDAAPGYERTRKLYSDAGIQVLELFHRSPAWLLTKGSSVFPNNLPVMGQSWEQIGQRWSPYWGGIEVWNEPDIISGGEGPGAEKYVPLAKTIKYTFQTAKVTTPVGGGVFAYFTGAYMELAAKNGLLQSVDFISFHYYKDPLFLENFVAGYRAYLKKFGRESLPLWITEAGKPWTGAPGSRPDTALDKTTALSFVELAIEAKACGIARLFPFTFVDYSEHGSNNFGMLDAAGTPLRSLAGYAQAIRTLANAVYIGDVDVGDKTLHARAFKTSGGQAIVVIEASAPDKFSVTLPFSADSVQGMDGRKIDGTQKPIPLADGLIYARVKMKGIQNALSTATPAMELQRVAKLPLDTIVASPIVLEASLDAKAFAYGVRGYEIPAGTKSIPVSVRVNNLSSAAQDVSVTVQPDSSSGSASSGGKTQDVSVPPQSSVNVVENVDASSVQYDSGGAGYLRVDGKGKDAGTVLPAVLRLSTPLGMDEYLKANSYHFALPIADIGRWKKNSSGDIEFSKSEAGNWQYTVAFNAGNHWAYPRFTLPQEVDLDRVTGILVRGRCEQPAAVRIMTWRGTDNNYNLTGGSIFPADGKWHVVYVPLSDFIPPGDGQKLGRQVRDISVGIGGSKSANNTVEVSDLFLLGN